MRASSIFLPALCASVFAAPVYPDLNVKAAMPDDAMSDISQYFNMLAQKTQEGRQMAAAPACDMSLAKLPVASKSCPDNKKLWSLHIENGRLTQKCQPPTPSQTSLRV